MARNGASRWAALAALGLMLAGCGMQATGRAPRHTGMGREPSTTDVSTLGIEEVEGRVQSIDPATGAIVVEQGDRTVRLEAAGETAVFVDGGVGAFEDLKEGLAVRASFSDEGGRRVAHWIELPRPEAEDSRDTGFEKAGSEVAR